MKILVATLGGSPRPIALSIKGHQPDAIYLFVTDGPSGSIKEIERKGERAVTSQEIRDTRGIRQICSEENIPFGLRSEDIVIIEPQNFALCIEAMYKKLKNLLPIWEEKKDEVVFDFTGGTKLMSAALALIARSSSAKISYVGAQSGANKEMKRSKGGIGVTLDGKEELLTLDNPWDVLGFGTIESGKRFFKASLYAAAVELFERHRERADSAEVKQQLSTWASFAGAYASWDAFRHETAKQSLGVVQRKFADLEHWLPDSSHQELKSQINSQIKFLGEIGKKPNRQWIIDLISNADRCAERGSHEDAVARLYRAVEAYAQWRLAERGIDTSAVRCNQLPASLLQKWEKQFQNDDSSAKIGLQGAYTLLNELKDDAGKRFQELKMHTPKSPLSARNNSILAHGFAPASKETFENLRSKTLELTAIGENELIVFPKL